MMFQPNFRQMPQMGGYSNVRERGMGDFGGMGGHNTGIVPPHMQAGMQTGGPGQMQGMQTGGLGQMFNAYQPQTGGGMQQMPMQFGMRTGGPMQYQAPEMQALARMFSQWGRR